MTRQRAAILEVIRSEKRHLTVEEIFELAKTCADEKRGYEAVACAQTAVIVDSDCEGARRFFGY